MDTENTPTPADTEAADRAATERTTEGVPGARCATVAAEDAAAAAATAAAAGSAAGRAVGRAESGAAADVTPPGAADEMLRTALAGSARRFTDLRLEGPDSDATLRAIVVGALEAIPNVAAASITLMDRDGTVTTHAPSDDLVAEVDAIQAELGEGPCVDALRESGDDVSDVPDLADPVAARWPRLASRAQEAGYGCLLSYQLVTRGSAGALNLWGRAPGRYSDHDRLLGALFADQAAVALAGARRAGQLNQALVSRDVIGRAKGVLMERFRIPDDAAFAMLVDSSQHTNMKLVDVATWLVTEAEATYTQEGGAATDR